MIKFLIKMSMNEYDIEILLTINWFLDEKLKICLPIFSNIRKIKKKFKIIVG